MADKIHPSFKQPTGTTTTKPHLRPLYRPQPRRNHRSFRRTFCLCFTFTFLTLIILSAVAGAVFYLLYRPHRPSFTVSSLQISQFNLTSSNHLNTKFNFTVTARNPNSKISFNFDSISVTFNSKGTDVGDGTVPDFILPEKSTKQLKTIVSATGRTVDDNDGGLKSDLKNRKMLPLVIRIDTKVKVKVKSLNLKTKSVPIRVVCDGIRVRAPNGKGITMASGTENVEYKVDLRIKIWKWTI